MATIIGLIIGIIAGGSTMVYVGGDNIGLLFLLIFSLIGLVMGKFWDMEELATKKELETVKKSNMLMITIIRKLAFEQRKIVFLNQMYVVAQEMGYNMQFSKEENEQLTLMIAEERARVEEAERQKVIKAYEEKRVSLVAELTRLRGLIDEADKLSIDEIEPMEKDFETMRQKIGANSVPVETDVNNGLAFTNLGNKIKAARDKWANYKAEVEKKIKATETSLNSLPAMPTV